jgi:hypothetical protein
VTARGRSCRKELRSKAVILILLVVVGIAPSASAWGPFTHRAMARQILAEKSIRPYVVLFHLDVEQVVLAATEPVPPEKYQWIGWPTIRNDGKEHSGFLDNPVFTELSFVRFLGCVLHDCEDCGMVMGHSPAREVYINTALEGILEAEFTSGQPIPPWPKVSLYAGPYSEKVKTFYRDQIELAKWVKTHSDTQNIPVGLARGVCNSLRLGQAVVLDVFLQLDPGDTNADGRVDCRDLLNLARHFGIRSGMTVDRGDLNADGAVDARDLEILMKNYGRPAVGGAVPVVQGPVSRPQSWKTSGTGAAKFLQDCLTPLFCARVLF